MTRDLTGETILAAGGRWDRIEKRYLDEQDPDFKWVQIKLAESQIPFVQWVAEWIADYRDGYPRDTSLVMIADDRRGGKTVAAATIICAGCIDVPISPVTRTPTLAAIVAKSYRERFELEDWILNRIPGGKSGLYRHRAAPEHQFVFHSGAVLRLLSADDPDAIKQGRFDLVFFNEPQKMSPRAVANGVMATADLGGLAILAANPPAQNDSRGEWLFDLKEALDDEAVAVSKGKRNDLLGIKYFTCPSAKNQFIDQQARKRSGRIAAIIDPSITAGDVEGEWRRPQELAAWEFKKHRHVAPVPQLGLHDCTAEVADIRGEPGKWSFVAGVDFDWRPYIVCVIYRIFGDMEDPLFWSIDEFAGESKWTTSQWIEAFGEWGEPKGYVKDSLLFIGDASSGWPGNDKDPKVSGRTSFETIQEAGWTIIPPQDHRGRGKVARNPRVDERLDLYNDLLRRDRLKMDPGNPQRSASLPSGCAWFIECNRRATTKKNGPRRRLVHNQFAHAMDAGTYPIWRLAPRIDDAIPLTPGDIRTVKIRRRP